MGEKKRERIVVAEIWGGVKKKKLHSQYFSQQIISD